MQRELEAEWEKVRNARQKEHFETARKRVLEAKALDAKLDAAEEAVDAQERAEGKAMDAKIRAEFEASAATCCCPRAPRTARTHRARRSPLRHRSPPSTG